MLKTRNNFIKKALNLCKYVYVYKYIQMINNDKKNYINYNKYRTRIENQFVYLMNLEHRTLCCHSHSHLLGLLYHLQV